MDVYLFYILCFTRTTSKNYVDLADKFLCTVIN